MKTIKHGWTVARQYPDGTAIYRTHGLNMDLWTSDPSKAVRFPTNERAHSYARQRVHVWYDVIPHSWLEDHSILHTPAWLSDIILSICRYRRERRYRKMIARIERAERMRKAMVPEPMQPLLPKQQRIAKQLAKMERDTAMLKNRNTFRK